MALIPPDPASVIDKELVADTSADTVCLPEHCFHAFDALYCALTDALPVPPAYTNDKYPLFVTWNTRRTGRASRLRGCIGTFEALPLHEGVPEYALISAFRDHRFRKIDQSELSSLECGISLLTDFEDAATYLDWTLGVHGIRISFPHPSLLPATSASGAPSPLSSSTSIPTVTSRQRFHAVYLPHVMPEQGWDKIESVDSAIRKAGWTGRISEDLRRSVNLVRFQSRKCTVGWDEYVGWREALGAEM
ncbi:AMMECR1 domain-containing protein [Schizophyllum amplum]|uniref:AMMECR1 domain-containing protein n=1 Tax=Schizophyllum amplum TaxID=97359 RepID=A0A550CUL3_9AGAR|nr:AMMECR1 domain-containing protein [Auriculariopsis ampla]